MSNKNIVYASYISKSDFRKDNCVIQASEVMQRNVLEHSGHTLSGTLLLETMWANRMDASPMFYRAHSEWEVDQPTFLAALLNLGMDTSSPGEHFLLPLICSPQDNRKSLMGDYLGLLPLVLS